MGECSRHLGESGMYCYWAGLGKVQSGDTLIVLVNVECVTRNEVK